MQTSHMIRAALLLAAVVWPGAGQIRTTPRSAPRPAAAAKSSAQPKSSDQQIEAAIRAKLAKSPKLGPEKIQVRVQGGVATLEGKTDVVQHKGTATRMAKSAGALAVNNHIQISDAAKQKAAANLATGRRRAQIKRGDARSETDTARSQVRNR